MFERAGKARIEADLQKKMVLLAGPRQVGKTTLAQSIYPENQLYLNYDAVKDRKMLIKGTWDQSKSLLVFDEIHKMKGWKRWLKGIWDTRKKDVKVLVTGSARLDFVRKSGESLAGRYFLHRLHPLSVRELQGLIKPEAALSRLLTAGGFPEPFFSEREVDVERWRRGHVERILREDLVELERITQIRTVELLIEFLSERVGSTISYTSLAEDLSVSPTTIKRWIEILEAFYIIFQVTPYSKDLKRSIRKEPKIFFYDTGLVQGDAARLENVVACHLLKANHYLEDHFGKKTMLHYVRDKEKREVDFLVTVNRTIERLVEVKSSDDYLSKSLMYYAERLKPGEAVQIVRNLDRSKNVKGYPIVSVANWLAALPG